MAEPLQKPDNILSLTDAAPYTLTTKQIQAAKLLAEGKPLEEIIATLKVSTRTFYKWKKLSAFNAEVTKHAATLQTQAMKQLHDDVNGLGPMAITVLMNAMNNNNAKVALEVAKAMGLLESKQENANDSIEIEFRTLSFEEYQKGK